MAHEYKNSGPGHVSFKRHSFHCNMNTDIKSSYSSKENFHPQAGNPQYPPSQDPFQQEDGPRKYYPPQHGYPPRAYDPVHNPPPHQVFHVPSEATKQKRTTCFVSMFCFFVLFYILFVFSAVLIFLTVGHR